MFQSFFNSGGRANADVEMGEDRLRYVGGPTEPLSHPLAPNLAPVTEQFIPPAADGVHMYPPSGAHTPLVSVEQTPQPEAAQNKHTDPQCEPQEVDTGMVAANSPQGAPDNSSNSHLPGVTVTDTPRRRSRPPSGPSDNKNMRADRVTKVQIVEQQSPQLAELIDNQVKTITELSSQLNRQNEQMLQMERQLQLMYEEQRKLQALVDTTKSHAEETEERAYRAEQFAQQMLDQQRYASPATPVEATHIPAPMDSTDSDLDGDKRLASSEDEVHDEMITVGNEKECQEAQWLRARVEDDDGPSSDDQGTPTPRYNVPPRMKFSRPRGGAGPTLKVNESFKPQLRMKGISIRNEETPEPTQSTTVEDKMDFIIESLYGVTKKLDSWGGYSKSPESRRKVRASAFKPSPNRARSPGRTEKLEKVRTEMNRLIGIKFDADILKGSISPPQDVVDLWEDDEQGRGPTLNPMRPYWGNIKSSWNYHLADMFYEHLCEKLDLDQNEALKDELHLMFYDRLSRLRRLLYKGSPKANETADQTKARQQRELAAKLTRQRPNTRRNTLFQTRQEIALGNQKRTDGDVNEAWRTLLTVVNELGATGMSSDESDQEESGQLVYIVKKREWRNRNLTELMKAIDRDYNTTNAYGNTRPGNPPRKRIRRGGVESFRTAVPGLPQNFYDDSWLSGLCGREINDLGAKGPIDLPEIVVD